MKKLQGLVAKAIPLYSFLPIIFCFLFNNLVYVGARLIAGDWYHYQLESSLDRWIPLIPETLVIYLGCYLFWMVNYTLIARQEKQRVYQFFAADFLSRCICLLFFLAFPTTNVRPELDDAGFWNMAMALLYTVDAADNLFPSIHCLVSWLCFVGIRGRKDIPRWYRVFSCMMAILVFVSTLTTKQHVLIDVAGGVVLAEFCFYLAARTRLASWYGHVFTKATNWLFQLSGEVEACGKKEKC